MNSFFKQFVYQIVDIVITNMFAYVWISNVKVIFLNIRSYEIFSYILYYLKNEFILFATFLIPYITSWLYLKF